MVSIDSPEVFYLRAPGGLVGGGSFGSKSPRVEIKIEERNELFMQAIRAIKEGVEHSDNNRIYMGLKTLTNLREDNRLPNYPIGSVRKLIDILSHPNMMGISTDLSFIQSSVREYFVALLFKQALESQNQDLGYFNDCLLYTSDAADE